MTDLIDCAATETEAYIAECIRRQRKPVEIPDEDESGRYCLGCTSKIDPRRIEKTPEAVRCVPCETVIENMGKEKKGEHGR